MASLSSGRPAVIAILMLLHLAWTNAATLEILPTGEFQSRPSGSKLFFTCKLSGVNDPTLGTIQWRDPFDRVIESRSLFSSNGKSRNPVVFTEKNPDNSLSLFFNPLKEDQTGLYTCIGTYAQTESFNKSVNVQTIDAITWVDAPETQYAVVGKEYRIKCQVSARPAPTVGWYLGNKEISTDDHYIVETHALKITNVRDEDSGFYICRAAVQQTGELEERLINLIVQEAPKLQENSSEVEIIEGKTSSITVCKSTAGKPPPLYSWVKSIYKENLTTANRFGVDRDTGVLTITDVRREDSGEYQCTAENPAGTASIVIRVNVIEKPKIMEFINKTQVAQKDVKITCKAYGRPPPTVVFKKQTKDKPFTKGIQANDDRIELSSETLDSNGETIATLSIQRVLREDDGIYECIATNKVGSSYRNGHLTVEFPPSFASMTNHSVWSWERRPVNLTCIAESIPNATIQWLHGERLISPSELSGSEAYAQFGNGPISTLRVTPIDTRYYGHYGCRAKNIHGEKTHTIQLKEGKRPDLIPQAQMSEVTATTMAFKIVPPPMEPELPVKTITVQYREYNQQWSQAKNKTWALNSPYILEQLNPATTYEFRFHATNDVGSGNWGAVFQENTPMRTVPNPPKFQPRTDNPSYDISLYGYQYELNWIAPPDNGEPIDKYEIQYCEIQRISGEWIQKDNTCLRDEIKGQRSKHMIRKLTPDTVYRVELKAHNSMGFGKSEIMKFKTAKESSGSTVDYSILSSGGSSKSNSIVHAIVTAFAIVFLAI